MKKRDLRFTVVVAVLFIIQFTIVVSVLMVQMELLTVNKFMRYQQNLDTKIIQLEGKKV